MLKKHNSLIFSINTEIFNEECFTEYM